MRWNMKHDVTFHHNVNLYHRFNCIRLDWGLSPHISLLVPGNENIFTSTLCPVVPSCHSQKVAGFLTAQTRHVFCIRRKTLRRGETSWASNQRLLPDWGTEGREAPRWVSQSLSKHSHIKKVHSHSSRLLKHTQAGLWTVVGQRKPCDNTATVNTRCLQSHQSQSGRNI